MKPSVSAEHFPESVLTLPSWGARAISFQILLLAVASFLLPAAAHLTGLSVRLLLPMHWPVLLVGLCYGWRSGFLIGLAAPGLSFLLSGMPYPVMIPSMMVELAAMGFVAGFVREQLRFNAFLTVVLAIVVGRFVFITGVVATGAAGGALLPYLKAAVVPGLGAAIAQIALLPVTASWWISRRAKK